RKEAIRELQILSSRLSADLFPAQAGRVIGDYVRFQTGFAFKSEWFSENGVRLARNANVSHGMLDWTETVRVSIERRAEFARFELQEGDILVSLDRPVISTGVKVAQVIKQDLPALLLQRVARARFQGNELIPEYFFRWLRSQRFIEAIDPGRSN